MQTHISDGDMDVIDFAKLIGRLPPHLPISDAMEAAGACKKEGGPANANTSPHGSEAKPPWATALTPAKPPTGLRNLPTTGSNAPRGSSGWLKPPASPPL